MAFVLKPRVGETSTSTGTGAFTLAGALGGHQAFDDVLSVNDTTEYMIVGFDGSWEEGIGTYSAANTLTRTTVTNSSNSGSAVNFAAGNKWVLMTPRAERYLTLGAGKHSLYFPASSLVPRTTNGAAYAETETTTNKIMLATLDFDAAADEFAQFSFRAPKSWNESTVTALFIWSHPSTATNFGVAWAIQGLAVGNDDALDAAFGTAVVTTDTGGTTDDVYHSAESSAITIAGTPAEGDLIVMQVFRDVSDAGDDLAVDARLHGVMLFLTTDANTDD